MLNEGEKLLNTLLGVLNNTEVKSLIYSANVSVMCQAMALGAEDTMENTTNLVSVLMELTFQWKRLIINYKLANKQSNT